VTHHQLVALKSLEAANEDVLGWVERAAVFLADQYGVPLITGRVLGWLMICDPPQQSAGQIADAIGASRASLTTSLRLLAAAGFVGRDSQPGDRVARYRVADDARETVLRRRPATLASFRDIAQAGMDLVGPTDPWAQRIRAAHDSFDWLAAMVADNPRDQAPKWHTEAATSHTRKG
jgi:DNA-binding MarR family transcriptional regulator